MQVHEITTASDWAALAGGHPLPLPQTWAYGAAVEAVGRDVQRLAVMDKDRPVALAQIVTRRVAGLRMGLLSNGPVALAAADPRRALRAACPWPTLVTPPRKWRGLPLSARPQVALWDLSPAPPDLRAGLHPKWRNALRAAEAEAAVTVSFPAATPDSLAPLLRAEKARQAAGHYRALPPEFALALHAAAPQSLLLVTALDAAMLFVQEGAGATYLISHAGPQARAANAPRALLWQAALRLRARGVTHLDLGTIDPAKAPDLARFKTRTGARVESLGAAVLL